MAPMDPFGPLQSPNGSLSWKVRYEVIRLSITCLINHKGFVDLLYDFWIQKSHHFYGFWIQNFFVHLYNFWIKKLQYFCGFWIQKPHHFYNFWIQKFVGPYSRFLDPETAVFLLFLDPETAPFLQFLDPEIFWSIFTISGSRNCSIFAVSGSCENFPPLLLPTNGLGAADKLMMVIIHLLPGSTQPAVHMIRTCLGGPSPWSFP